MSKKQTGETKIEAAVALRAYQAIVDRGTRSDDGFSLGGLTAVADYDGYGVTLSDGAVTVRVLFHNRVQIDAPSGRALKQFRRRLNRVVDGR